MDSIRKDLPEFAVGDNISVYNIIRDEGKSRVQIFKGLVIKRKGTGPSATFTIRKISDGIGVEKVFPLNSPNIEKIEVNKLGSVRRSKIYYMRDRIGKLAMKVRPVTDLESKKYEERENARLEEIAKVEKAAAD